MLDIDEEAKSQVVRKFAMPESLHLPIAAKSVESIIQYVGTIERELSKPNTSKAFLVNVPEPLEINSNLRIWDLPKSSILHQRLQVWVHVDYRGYRKAYTKAFPNEDISKSVLDHIENRRMAKLKYYNFVRLIPISRGANSSSGSLSEKWGVEYHGSPEMQEKHRTKKQCIQYADISCLAKMLDIKVGGGVMDVVNEAQSLLLEK